MSRWFCQISWDEVPHLDKKAKDELYKSIPEYQRDARSKGIPQLGAGAIYPIAESQILVDDFAIPAHWPRAWGLDSGWNWTAVVWGALNRDDGTLYLYSCYKRGQEAPAIHAEAVRSRGAWIPGVGDSAQINVIDGRQLISVYRDDLGLDITLPVKAVEAGIYACWTGFTAGKLKVFRSLTQWLAEYRFYQRDDKGKVIKGNDHLMDATRYLVMSGMDRAITVPAAQEPVQRDYVMYEERSSLGWMGA